MKVQVTLNQAETEALEQIHRRLNPAMNGFQRDLLAQVLRQVERQREAQLSHDRCAERFVWKAGDVKVLRRRVPVEVTADMPSPEEQRALLDYIDQVLRDAGH